MKIRLNSARGCRPASAFTLVETMIAAVIFMGIFIGVLVAMQVFGLRQYTMGATKVSAMNGAMKILNQVRDGIRSANDLDVGNLTTPSDPSTFTLTGDTNKNVGAALRICPTTNTYPFTIFYLDTTAGSNYAFKMATTPDGVHFPSNSIVTLANYITNTMVFDAEDCQGNILTNDSNNRIIRMELDFYQWEYPVGVVGGAGINAYDFYRLTTKISRRLID